MYWFFLWLFSAFDFCRFCVVFRFFHPRHNGQWPPTLKDFLSQILSITFYFPILILEKEPVFSLLNVKCLKHGTIFITSLVWRGPWLGIEPGTSRTRSQHYTTRLSRRRCCNQCDEFHNYYIFNFLAFDFCRFNNSTIRSYYNIGK